MKRTFLPYIILAMALMVSSCGSKKALTTTTTTSPTSPTVSTAGTSNIDYMRSVADNAVYSNDIVAKIKFSVKTSDRDVSLDGQLHMRKNDVIRLQLAPLGLFEVARIEFTQDQVLFMDRVHKEYIQGSYSDLAFLQRNGIDFYTLQALFWNQLFLPGVTKIGEEELARFEVDGGKVSLQRDKMKFDWTTSTEKATRGRITQACATYTDSRNGASTLSWNYDAFKAMGSKFFPTKHHVEVRAQTDGRVKVTVMDLRLDKLSNDSDWETRTKVSSKYKRMDAESVLRKIFGGE
ncbi:MAG: DUF4292 domain-containing protein [Prevotella sp.]|nr:DUF4292 domain-containing protein [Prevotella sp.]